MTTFSATISEQIDFHGEKLGIEQETISSNDSERIVEPFDPEDIDVITRTMTVDLLLSRARSNMIDLQPDFQRRWGIWDQRRQSRLIESLLLRIPLPVLYAAENEDERWEIVDGIQRLSTIARFIAPEIIETSALALDGLEYLHAQNNKTFTQLTPRLQLRLRETELVIHLIRKGTPPEVKFNVFARINTGGVALSPQELRHAITPGPVRKILERLASSPTFLQATAGSVRAIRMDDRELVLRFFAFYVLGITQYRQPDMDGFLIRAMRDLNEIGIDRLQAAEEAFARSMWAAFQIFGDDAFRKRFAVGYVRLPINKALFEAVSVNLAVLNIESLRSLVARKERVRSGFILLCNERSFESAVSQGTGDIARVNRRFFALQKLFSEIVNEAV